MTLRFSCSGRCQDRVGRTGEWKKVGDVDSPRLIAMLILSVAERRGAVPVTCLCSTCVLGHKNVLAPSAAIYIM